MANITKKKAHKALLLLNNIEWLIRTYGTSQNTLVKIKT